MALEERVYSVLIVSQSEKFKTSLTPLLPKTNFSPVTFAPSFSSAKKMLLERHYDLLIINTPLLDDFGTKLAIDASNENWQEQENARRARLVAQMGQKYLKLRGRRALVRQTQQDLYQLIGAQSAVYLIEEDGLAQPLCCPEDCAAAAENMLLAADSLGVGGCYIGQGWTAFADPYGQELLRRWGIRTDHYAVLQVLLGRPREGDPHPATKPRKEGRVLRV